MKYCGPASCPTCTPWTCARERLPRWASSQTCQSWRFVRSQNSTASPASNPGAAIASGANSHSQTIRVRSTPTGQSVCVRT